MQIMLQGPRITCVSINLCNTQRIFHRYTSLDSSHTKYMMILADIQNSKKYNVPEYRIYHYQ